MAKKTKKCIVCGTEYKFCPTCTEDKFKPAWMIEFCCENCKKIFEICTKFNMDLLSKEEAKAALEKCDISSKSSFRSDVKKDLDTILGGVKAAPVKAEIKEAPAPKTESKLKTPFKKEARK